MPTQHADHNTYTKLLAVTIIAAHELSCKLLTVLHVLQADIPSSQLIARETRQSRLAQVDGRTRTVPVASKLAAEGLGQGAMAP